VDFAATAAVTENTSELLDEALRLAADAESAASADASSRPEGSPERTRAEDEVAALRLLRIQALHAKGTASPAGRAALAQALDEIEKFTWDYVGTLPLRVGVPVEGTRARRDGTRARSV